VVTGIAHHGAMGPGCIRLLVASALGALVAACGPAAPDVTPPITPGTVSAPREVNIVERDYGYSPSVIDLVPGETVILHVINGGLETHEAVVGSLDDQLAYEAAEAATVGSAPGPTPVIASPAGFAGIRVVAGSGQRVDVTWTVPIDAASVATGWFVGCHIPGHWAKGMVVPVRLVGPDGRPLGTPPPLPIPSPGG
jgi:uncharacterized cupredoxin-like copper-binding protein